MVTRQLLLVSLPATFALIGLMGCDAQVNTAPAPVVEKKETTIVNPPAEKKTETNTTIVNPPPAEKK